MGNELSVPQKNEEKMNESAADSSQIAPESGCVQNGLPATESALIVQQKNDASTQTSVNQGNVATSSHTTMEISTISEANGKNLGKEAKAPAPAAKSRFFLTLSRPVPGRTRDQGTDSSVGSVSLDVSSENPPANKASSENMKLPATAALEEDSDKTQNQVPAEASLSTTEQPASPPPEAEGAAPARPKEPSFFDKFFKLDKKKENIPVPFGIQEGTDNTENQHLDRETPGLPSQSNNVPEEKDLVDSREKSEQENSVGVNSSVPEDRKQPEIVQENPQTEHTTENNYSVMSFFKTLVSSNKGETKTDSEDKGSKAEKVHDGPSGQKTTGEVQAKGAKKKNPESPSLGYAFRKFFRHKSSKETQSTSNTKGAEKSPASSANTKSDKATSSSPEAQGTQKNTKGLDSSAQQQTTASPESAKNGTKEKSPTSLPLGKLFWKKSIKEDTVPKGAEENEACEAPVELTKSEDIEASLQTIELNEEEAVSPEPAPAKPNEEENRSRKTNLRLFLRQLSMRGVGDFTNSEEVNGKDSDGQTSDSTEKAVTPPETEPAGPGQKNKEASKEKKPTADPNKQKGNKKNSTEQANSPDLRGAEKNSMQNGGGSKENPLKRPEKRQSLGGFFKGLGPKRMSDAEVQTDPVSIGPVGKSK
ncbi:breast carcinoma-amplified sequence 1 isoform X2 [Phascolarctos cinereus]|uniref:Breast carcinoma-amplified sequence 1 isoform X2 n=1 Tax=Phascolarctos cinereus TaxID=38626 RepID=A0A6P5K3N5_PHACI|nr:breast carcinoma-amplified sequence 1 isoform X2 [Phascolarctos cinereus]